ncbi:sugar kinase [Cellulomonas sp. C5510]|uniref:sugar kinase n=1 Tax=Cellulomonas sp. C5510 TaxID=2871170 RepID=UPI001C98DBF4|nr:sugar kinase [Cellulomonas sp. C5510]QZN85379.1 sugar kinase [Cellulomonas sp. C5510]
MSACPPLPGPSAPGIVTVGETLACLALPAHGAVGRSGGLGLSTGGAESNAAVAASRLGVRTAWIGRVGDDDLGSLVVRELRGAGVDVVARRDDRAPTGLMVKEHRGGRPVRVRYYRAGSAGSRLRPADVDADLVGGAAALHVTGVTAALGAGPRAAAMHAVAVARAAGTLVSVDVNFRATLWSEREAVGPLRDLTALADVVFAGEEEASLVLDGRVGAPAEAGGPVWDRAELLARRLLSLGPTTAVVKLGALGALVLGPAGVHRQAAYPVAVVDPVGAGDAFAGGFLGETVLGRPAAHAAETGARLGALACAAPGDWEGVLDWRADRAGAEGVRVAEVAR